MIPLRIAAAFGAVGVVMTIIGCDAIAAGCDTPGFTFPQSGPVRMQAAGQNASVSAIAAGSFFKRVGETAVCGCDLAVAITQNGSIPPSGGGDVVVLMRVSKDGGFSQTGDGAIQLATKNPVAIASGRFSAQGPTDLDDLVIVTDRGPMPGEVTLFKPNNDGTYQPNPAVPVGVGPAVGPPGDFNGATAIAIGDFNGDNKLDLAVISLKDRRVTVLLGDGTGLFPTRLVSDDLGGKPQSVVAGHFFGQGGADDLAVAITDVTSTAVSITVLRANSQNKLDLVKNPPMAGDFALEARMDVASALVADSRSDLVIGFWNGAGNNVGGTVKVLLGDGHGGFTPSQTLPFQARPRFVKVIDINEDGIGDLMVAAFSDESATQNNRIQVFQGIGGEQPFKAQPPLFTMQPIRLTPLTTGKFGGQHIGFAGADPDSGGISVLVGNGTNGFASPKASQSAVPADAGMFVVGDFHNLLADTSPGSTSLHDLAYVHFDVPRLDDPSRKENQLVVLLNDGDRTFQPRGDPIPLKATPLLLAAGKFDRDQIHRPPTVDTVDVALIDANPGDARHTPLLKILFGKGQGNFEMGIQEFDLDPGDKPVAMLTGNFKGDNRPDDIAVVSETSAGGKLTLFFNDGTGQFPRTGRLVETFNFTPGAIAGSTRFRPGGRFDFVVKEKDTGRFMFFASGDGGFTRRQMFAGNPTDFGPGSKPELILVGDLNSDGFDEVVMVNGDLGIDVFRNADQDGHFEFRQSIDILKQFGDPSGGPGSITLRLGSGSKFFLEDFGDGRPSLVALLGLANGKVNDRSPLHGDFGVMMLKGDGDFGFADANLIIKTLQPAELQLQTIFTTDPVSTETLGAGMSAVFIGRFGNPLHGRSNLDLASMTSVHSAKSTVGACPSPPAPANPGPERVCHEEFRLSNFDDCKIKCPSAKCLGICMAPTCLIPPCPHPNFTCTAKCEPDPPVQVCEDKPRVATCQSTSQESYVLVLSNSCGD